MMDDRHHTPRASLLSTRASTSRLRAIPASVQGTNSGEKPTMLRRVALLLALLVFTPLTHAANFPGWQRTYQPDQLLLTSPQDDYGVVQFLLIPAQHEPGNVQVEFKKAINEIVGGLGADMALAKRSGLRVEGGLLFEVLTTRMEGIDLDVLIFAYDTGAKMYQVGLLMYVSAIPDTDRRVNHALDFIATATRKKFRMTDPRAFDRSAPQAQTVTAYTNTQTAPTPPPMPAAPAPQPQAQQSGKKCERRPVWGFRVSYWCQPSGICPDRVIKGYETVCE